MEDTVAILRGLKSKYEVHHGVAIQDDALIAAAQLSGRFLAERKQPDKSIDLIDEAAARLKVCAPAPTPLLATFATIPLHRSPPHRSMSQRSLSHISFARGYINIWEYVNMFSSSRRANPM